MHTPTKAQMQVVIDNLKKILPRAMHEGALDMYEHAVNMEGHECGTTHCFAGWYVVATLDTSAEKLNFIDGKVQMHRDLGYEFNTFNHWADEYPKLWGNRFGLGLFCDKLAFSHPDKRPDGAEDLQGIVDHLEEVRDRLPL